MCRGARGGADRLWGLAAAVVVLLIAVACVVVVVLPSDWRAIAVGAGVWWRWFRRGVASGWQRLRSYRTLTVSQWDSEDYGIILEECPFDSAYYDVT